MVSCGSKRWCAKYRFDGKEKRLALGSYSTVSLKAAREKRDAARKMRGKGTDPALCALNEDHASLPLAFSREGLSHPAKTLPVEMARQFGRDNNGRLLASAGPSANGSRPG